VVPATPEAEAEGSPESWSSVPTWPTQRDTFSKIIIIIIKGFKFI
jgi:hypothetical protein